MGPNNFAAGGNTPNRLTPNTPDRRPIQDFNGPQRPVQRPINDFAPQVQPNNMQPQPRPRTQAQPQSPRRMFPQNTDPRFQRPANPAQTPQQPPAHPSTTFEPPPSIKKRKLFGVNKFVVAGTAALLLAAGGFAFINIDKKDSTTVANAQNSQPAVKPLEKPTFTTYYPSSLPAGLTVAKGSISYYKESFTFILEEGGKKSFFVYEQPANTDPDLNNLKSKLAAPQNISLTLGQGIEGSMDSGTVTAVKTDKDTLIIINCVKAVCSTAPRDILSSMQVNSELEGIKQSNS